MIRVKKLPTGEVHMYKCREDGHWIIEDATSGDINSYESQEQANKDFDKIWDYETLTQIMGWEND